MKPKNFVNEIPYSQKKYLSNFIDAQDCTEHSFVFCSESTVYVNFNKTNILIWQPILKKHEKS